MAPIVIGIVGGIASGKSTVAEWIASARPADHLDADAIARRAMRRPEVRARIRRRFPAAAARGGIDRERLAREVFADRRALEDLEAIVHPPTVAALRRAIRASRSGVVLLDAPLLQETGADALCDRVVYVACPARTRRARARRARGWTEGEHRAREARLWGMRRKRARAHLVVDNGGGRARALRGVKAVLREIARLEAARARKKR
jgi:dephospho-CoA kinase